MAEGFDKKQYQREYMARRRDKSNKMSNKEALDSLTPFEGAREHRSAAGTLIPAVPGFEEEQLSRDLYEHGKAAMPKGLKVSGEHRHICPDCGAEWYCKFVQDGRCWRDPHCAGQCGGDRYARWSAARKAGEDWPYSKEVKFPLVKGRKDSFGVQERQRVCSECPGLTFTDLASHSEHLATHNPTPAQWAGAYEIIASFKKVKDA